MKYAYLDRGNILHVSASKSIAAQYSKNSRVIETELPAKNGFPVAGGQKVFMYSPGEMYIGGNDRSGKQAAPEDVPELAKLYKSLM